MSRYQQLPVGVFDTQAQGIVLPRTEAWKDYQQWLASGNAPDPEAAPSAQESLKQRRDAHRQRVMAQDAESAALGVNVGGNRYKLDADDRATLIGVLASVNAGNALPANFGWRDKSGTFNSLTLNQLKNLIEKVTQRDFDRRVKVWALLYAIAASPNPDAPFINDAPNPDYADITSGWPT